MKNIRKCINVLGVISLFVLMTLSTDLVTNSFEAHAATITSSQVLSAGLNYYGTLGDGTTTDSANLVAPVNLGAAVDVAAGDNHSLALMPDGTVWTWGRKNTARYLDSPSGVNLTPVQVSNLNGVTAIAAGVVHNLALKADGTVWAWGYNGGGQLGNGKSGRFEYGAYPAKVLYITDVVAIAGGGSHSLALKDDGTVWAWGANGYGQLGDGTSSNLKTTPVQVINLNGIVAIAAGTDHSLAIKDDGTIWAWGNNSYGQIGNGEAGWNTLVSTPQQVVGITDAVRITGGRDHSMAIRANGSVVAWGSNRYMQLGDGTTADSALPIEAINLTDAVAIAARSVHSLAIKNDGTVWAWGKNFAGQFGDGTIEEGVGAAPTQNPYIKNAVAIAAGHGHSLFLSEFVVQGPALSAGLNYYGTLGDGTTTDSANLVAPVNLGDAVDVAAGDSHNLALMPDGTVWIWGRKNTARYLDSPSGVNLTPVQVSNLNGVTAIAAGVVHNLALKADGTVWAWGYNGGGQLGNGKSGRFEYGAYPAKVLYITDVVAIAGGGSHSLALKTDGTVWAWGANGYGQLGDGTSANVKTVPVQVLNLSGIVAIAAGTDHSLAIKDDGTIWAWGNNSYGQIGNGEAGWNTLVSTPQQVVGITDAVRIAGGRDHSMAIRANGSVVAWGSNRYMQLGDGTTADSALPIEAINLTDAVAIAARSVHSLAIKNDGTVWAWGKNFAGQFGDGTTSGVGAAPTQNPYIQNAFAIAAGHGHSLFLTE